jgi:hypothetical protein
MLGVNARQFPEKIAAMVREEMTKDTRFAQTGLPQEEGLPSQSPRMFQFGSNIRFGHFD